ncbi:hypothetical protein C8F04DRAFT_90834 [Mycena alexandri]|uniref:Uncharacterized protein n=1 Tax=Mycena alexandri TaxID=1745969 RepID=A0AAD6WWM4_9AGAR|nr:hypothetical protein C8F04DRAFT_90834 [Mycena alexandri]
MSSSRPSTSGTPTPPQRKGTFRAFQATSSRSSAKSDWLAASILIAKTATAAGEFGPFPYIKGRSQRAVRKSINEIVEIVRDQISVHGDTAAVKLKGQCEEFAKILRDMLQTVEKMQKRNHLKQFIRSSRISAEISGYEKRIEALLSRINFISGLETSFGMAEMHSKVHAIHAMMSPDSAHVQVPQNINNCPPPTRIFQGREKILAKMQEYFAQDLGKQHIYVLHGLGGAGKTQIGLKFIQESSRWVK